MLWKKLEQAVGRVTEETYIREEAREVFFEAIAFELTPE